MPVPAQCQAPARQRDRFATSRPGCPFWPFPCKTHPWCQPRAWHQGWEALEREDAPALELDRVDVGRELEMGPQRLGGAVRLVGGARVEQFDVELLVPVLERALGEQHRPVALAAVPR